MKIPARQLQTWAMLILLAAIWGASFLFMRIAAPVFGSISLMAMRVSLAAAALFLYAIFQSSLPDFRRRWKQYLLIGALNNAIPFVLIANSVIALNASISAILNATTPLFTALIATVWIHEPFGWRRALGVGAGFLGVVILVGYSPLPLSTKVILGVIQSLLGALSYALGALYLRTRFQGEKPLHNSLGQLTGATVLVLPLVAFSIPATPPSLTVLLAALALALICTALAYLIYMHLIASAGPITAVSVAFLIPIFSILWGVLFLQEPLSLGMFVGLGVILASVGLVISR